MNFDTLSYPHLSKRNCIVGKNGVVATSNVLAAQAGLDVLKKGGNAIDAAVATAICLTVVEPTSNGIGGDNFAIIWKDGKLHGLNSSGYSPKNISIKKVKEKGFNEIPKFGWEAVTVPGVPAGWAETVRKYGNLSLSEIAEPAIEYARNGFPVQPTVSENWKRAFEIYKRSLSGEKFKSWFDTFTFNGKTPEAGDIVCLPDHANTIEEIAKSFADSFYNGNIASKIVEYSEKTGGYLSREDLKEFANEWVEPVGVNYRGYDIWEIPPNGQGIIALEALAILSGFELDKRNADFFHKQIESLKLAFEDGKKHITQSNKMKFRYERLLQENYISRRRNMICDEAIMPAADDPMSSGTVYLATADKYGNMVSFIQSNYMGFGSGLVVPGTGIALQNRGHSFSLNEEHVNSLEPLKKPYHTIIPGFITKENEAIGPFGVMGGFMQPQGHLQVISNMIDLHENPQAALDAPRWQWTGEKNIIVEKDFPTDIALELQRKGHNLKVEINSGMFGRGQIIVKSENGSYISGTEKRTDSGIAVW